MQTFPPRVALITGAGSGLGLELARQLARQGSAIAAVDRNAAALHTLADELRQAGQRVASAVADVTHAGEMKLQIEALEAALGPIELLIASAGVGIETSARNFVADDIAHVIQVNLIGVANSIAAVLPGMLRRGRGHVSAISSLASLHGMPRLLAYCASKSGLNAFLEGLRVEVKPFGIAVTTICPGWVRTPMTAAIKGRLPGLMHADRAATLILEALRRRQPFFAFPRRLAWRLRLLRLLPAAWSDAILAATTERLKEA